MNASRSSRSAMASNVPVHITYSLLFLYLAGSRYLIYFGPGKTLIDIPVAKALGASLAYFLIWGLGYWFGATSSKKTLVTWLGGIAVFLSTLLAPLVGYLMLVIIWFLRRRQEIGINEGP